MELPVRKNIRMEFYNYKDPGYYFITICTRNKEKLLCDIVGTGLPDGPLVQLKEYGTTAKQQLDRMAHFYEHIVLEKYVIMPNHIHLLLYIPGIFPDCNSGTKQNNPISQFIGTFKRFCNRSIGMNIWQMRSYDHVIRCEEDYRNVCDYMATNPARWLEDRFYTE